MCLAIILAVANVLVGCAIKQTEEKICARIKECNGSLTRDPRTNEIIGASLENNSGGDEITELCRGFKHLIWYENDSAKLSGRGCSDLGKLLSLERLSLVHLGVNTQWTTEIGKLKNLTLLGVLDCELTDADLAPLAGLTKLRELRLQKTKVSGSGLSSLLANSGTLKKLILDGAAINDRGLETISKFRELSELTLATTQVTDAGLPQLLQLQKLEHLRLTDSKVTKTGVSEFQQEFISRVENSAKQQPDQSTPSRRNLRIEFVTF